MTHEDELKQIHRKHVQEAWRKVDEWQDLQRHHGQRLREELDNVLLNERR